MQIYRHINDFPKNTCPVLTLGTFDGVHMGHQKILAHLRNIAETTDGKVTLLTFYPHPRKVLFPEMTDMQLLSTLDEKCNLLEKYGVQQLIIQPFSRDFSMLDHDDFIKNILVDKLGVKTLVIGYDHQFGHNRKGSFKDLQELAPSMGFNVVEIPKQDIEATAVSSTRIRKALFRGEVELAAHLLGYDYTISGQVVKGNQIGRTIGFPTANINVEDPEKLIPANGVYAVMVNVNGQLHRGAMNIGTRPTFDNGERKLEVFLLNFDKDIYGERITVHFKFRLRDELKFPSVDKLIEQMNVDIRTTLELLPVI